MYFEEAEVKEYARKNGTKYYQIHLGTKSKFRKEEEVIVVNAEVFNEFISKANPDYINKLEADNEDKEKLIEKLEHDLQDMKQHLEESNSKLDVAKEEIFKLNDEADKLKKSLTSEKDNLLAEKEKLVDEKETSKKLMASITKLNNEKSELEKEIIFLKNRGLLNRIINKQYNKEENVPELVEAEVNSTSKE